jgi:hypothetical protein
MSNDDSDTTRHFGRIGVGILLVVNTTTFGSLESVSQSGVGACASACAFVFVGCLLLQIQSQEEYIDQRRQQKDFGVDGCCQVMRARTAMQIPR